MAAMLLSIHSKYAERIFLGEKTIELRRRRPRLNAGDEVVIYAPGPVREIVGSFRVARFVSGSPTSLWRRLGPRTGLTRREYQSYFSGARLAFGIGIVHPLQLRHPISLLTLRAALPGFQPPQSYYLIDRACPKRVDGWYDLYQAALAKQQAGSASQRCR